MANVKLQRVAPGYYESSDGRFVIHGHYVTPDEARGYSAGMRWCFTDNTDQAHDLFPTKREAVAALNDYISTTSSGRS